MTKFNWKKTAKPVIILAPMDGWSNSPMRQAIKKITPEVITFTEFVSVDGLTHKNRSKNLLQKAIYHEKTEKPLIVQLFGKDPEKFALASSMMEEMGAGAIDINFGCPARKVVGHKNGAYLLQEPDLAYEIVRQTKAATNLQVSVKTRLGWDNPEQIFDFGELMIKAGADALTIHGRTAKQAFTGEADYTNIYKFKKLHPDFIVIGNGDIKDRTKSMELASKLDGFMIGREANANPFIFKQILEPDFTPSLNDKIELVLFQAQLAQEQNGQAGVIAMRKFFAFVVRGLEGASEYRKELMQVDNIDEARRIFTKIKNEF
jgi:nifR3 family TIM-barrel protein